MHVRRFLFTMCLLLFGSPSFFYAQVQSRLDHIAVGPMETLVRYDRSIGERPEGIVMDNAGNLYVSLAPRGEIRKIDVFGSQTLFATFETGPGPGVLGLEVDLMGNLYAAVASLNPASNGVWRVSPDGNKTRLPGSQKIFWPNGLAFDELGNLYVSESIASLTPPGGGGVWRITPGGTAKVWANDVLLSGIPSLPPPFPPLGANGIAYRQGKVYVANTSRGQILRIPVEADGSAGPVEPVTVGILGNDSSLFPVDGIALDAQGNFYVLVIGSHKLVRLLPDGGAPTVLADVSDGLDFPASAAFGTVRGTRTTLFITNYSLQPLINNPAVMKMDVGIPGPPTIGQPLSP